MSDQLPTPIKDQVLVRQDPPKEKVGSGVLFAPQGSEEYPPMGTVLKVGPGKVGPGGGRIPLDVKPGDRVMFKRKPGSALVPDAREGDERGWKDLLVLTEDDILLVLEPS